MPQRRDTRKRSLVNTCTAHYGKCQTRAKISPKTVKNQVQKVQVCVSAFVFAVSLVHTGIIKLSHLCAPG